MMTDSLGIDLAHASVDHMTNVKAFSIRMCKKKKKKKRGGGGGGREGGRGGAGG